MKIYTIRSVCKTCSKEFTYERKNPQGTPRTYCADHRDRIRPARGRPMKNVVAIREVEPANG